MTRFLGGVACVGLLAFLCAGAPAPASSGKGKAPRKEAHAGPLEGTRWSVTVTPDPATRENGGRPFQDTLVFEDGKVTMPTCVTYGFEPSPYTATSSGGVVSFMTRQAGPEAGKSTWAGDFKDGTVSGTMVWTKKDGTVLSYAFDGKRVAR